jgi:hypothetical protein
MRRTGSRLRCRVLTRVLAACLLGTALSSFSDPTVAQNVPGKDIAGCSRDEILRIASPDLSWVAFVQEEVCSDGAFVTTIDDIVQLARRGVVPKHKSDVFAIAEHGDPGSRPVLRWLSDQKLQITVPNRSLIGLRKNRYRGIDVVVRFDPDDPIARQQFLQNLGLDPE